MFSACSFTPAADGSQKRGQRPAWLISPHIGRRVCAEPVQASLTIDTSGVVQVRALLYVGHWAGLLSGLSGHQFGRESIRLARNRRRPSAQGTDARAEARGLRVEAEQSCVALGFDLHVAGGAGRIARRDREGPAPGDQAQDMPHARGLPKAAPARVSSFDAGAMEPTRRAERGPTQHRRRRQEELTAEYAKYAENRLPSASAFRVFRVFRGLSPSRNSSPPAINFHYCRAEQHGEKELSA